MKIRWWVRNAVTLQISISLQSDTNNNNNNKTNEYIILQLRQSHQNLFDDFPNHNFTLMNNVNRVFHVTKWYYFLTIDLKRFLILTRCNQIWTMEEGEILQSVKLYVITEIYVHSLRGKQLLLGSNICSFSRTFKRMKLCRWWSCTVISTWDLSLKVADTII